MNFKERYHKRRIIEGLAWSSASYVTTESTENVPVVETPSPPPVLPPGGGLYTCVLISQTPVDGSIYAPGSEFSMVWQLQNTGSDPWNVADTRAVLVAAAENVSLSSVDQMDLTSDVPAGGNYQLSLSMRAPDATGHYSETWAVVHGERTLCQVHNIIQVRQKPPAGSSSVIRCIPLLTGVDVVPNL